MLDVIMVIANDVLKLIFHGELIQGVRYSYEGEFDLTVLEIKINN